MIYQGLDKNAWPETRRWGGTRRGKMAMIESRLRRRRLMTTVGALLLGSLAVWAQLPTPGGTPQVAVESLDRPRFLRRVTRDRNWDQLLQASGEAFDLEAATRLVDSRTGHNTPNRQDVQVNWLIDRLRNAAAEEPHRRVGYDQQRYMVENMMFPSAATLPLFQAHRSPIKGYEPLHGFKLRFETTWLEKR